MTQLESIVATLADRYGPACAPPVALDGGISNRNFRVRFAGEDCVVRLPGRGAGLLGVSREAERLASARAAELGVGPPLLAAGEDYLVTRFLDGAPPDPDRLRSDPGPVARALRAFHDSGLRLPVGFWVPDLLGAYAEIIARRGRELPAGYGSAQALVGRIAAVLPLRTAVPCHDDLLPGNLLQSDDGGVVLLDWEYAGMGHRLFDLGNLATNNGFDESAVERLLRAYDGVPPTPARCAALALMRIVSDAREAAWGVVQAAVSDIEFDFDGYADRHFERLERSAADPRLTDWLEVADGATP